MAEMKLVAIKMPAQVIGSAKKQAKKQGYVKPDGTANMSAYMRSLVINDGRRK